MGRAFLKSHFKLRYLKAMPWVCTRGVRCAVCGVSALQMRGRISRWREAATQRRLRRPACITRSELGRVVFKLLGAVGL